MLQRHSMAGLAFGLATLTLASPLAAFPISIVTDAHPDVYTGEWKIQFETGDLTGNHTIELDPGAYALFPGSFGQFRFQVLESGEVIPVSPNAADAADYSGGTITFRTTVISIDPAAYIGQWQIPGVTERLPGPRDMVVVPAITQVIGVANYGNFLIDVDAAGNVTSQNAPAATGSGPLLTFNTTTVDADVGAYAGEWQFARIGPRDPGSRRTVVVPNLQYHLGAGNVGDFYIFVEPDGAVTSLDPVAVTGDPGPVSNGEGSMTFANTTIVIDPGAHAGVWALGGVVRRTSGVVSTVVVPGLRYQIAADDGTGFRSTIFAVDDPCVEQTLEDFPPGSGNDFTIGCGLDVPAFACLGFEPPMRNSPVTVRGDRALPLKAELVDADGFAVDDLDVAAAPVLQVLFSPAGGGAPVDVTDDALPAGQGDLGNQFAFSSDRWRYNLRTENHAAAGEYMLSMASGDGQAYAIDPTCEATFVRQ